MSARLLTALILPTLVLSVALTPTRAAQQPIEAPKVEKQGNAEKPRLVTKVYQVIDLIIPFQATSETPPVQADCRTKVVPCSTSPVAVYRRLSGKPCKESACTSACTETAESALIALIKTTIAPQCWNDVGGSATVEYFPLTHALVINAPPDVQEQIADLLAAIRRLIYQEVVCELRFVSVADAVYDRLKEDFALKDAPDAPLASFDDKQVSKLMEAAQSDSLTHVMQAPKITLFNGQAAAIRVEDNQFCATSMNMRWDGENMLFVPLNEMISTGLRVNLQPTVSADHRYVDLSLNVQFRKIEGDKIPLVPVVTYLKPDPATGSASGCCPIGAADRKPSCPAPEITKLKKDGNVVIFTHFIQTPKVAKVSLGRKLTLPEGKTAVLFGWKQTQEVTDETPVLSKLPYVGKLYRHTRHAPTTTLVLVTPRVITAPEAEEVLPPLHAKKTVKHTGGTEEAEAPPSVDELLAKYHKACAAGKLETARKIAVKALKADPTCFDKQR